MRRLLPVVLLLMIPRPSHAQARGSEGLGDPRAHLQPVREEWDEPTDDDPAGRVTAEVFSGLLFAALTGVAGAVLGCVLGEAASSSTSSGCGGVAGPFTGMQIGVGLGSALGVSLAAHVAGARSDLGASLAGGTIGSATASLWLIPQYALRGGEWGYFYFLSVPVFSVTGAVIGAELQHQARRDSSTPTVRVAATPGGMQVQGTF